MTVTDSDPQKLGCHWRILETFFPSLNYIVLYKIDKICHSHAHIEMFWFAAFGFVAWDRGTGLT